MLHHAQPSFSIWKLCCHADDSTANTVLGTGDSLRMVSSVCCLYQMPARHQLLVKGGDARQRFKGALPGKSSAGATGSSVALAPCCCTLTGYPVCMHHMHFLHTFLLT